MIEKSAEGLPLHEFKKPWLVWEPGMRIIEGAIVTDVDIPRQKLEVVFRGAREPHYWDADMCIIAKVHAGTLALLAEQIRKRREEPEGAGPLLHAGLWLWMKHSRWVSVDDLAASSFMSFGAKSLYDLISAVVEVTP